MKYDKIIGIDVGKKELEVHIYPDNLSQTFSNTTEGIKGLVEMGKECDPSLLYCFEHTGIYSQKLALYLSEQEIPFCMVPGLEIKRSLGISRGKSDRIDAVKIAQYAYRRREEITTSRLADERIVEIKKLLSLRDKLVSHRAGYKATLSEYKLFINKQENQLLFDVHEKMIKELSKQIDKIESKIDKLITSDKQLKKQFDLITGIRGVGPQTALFMIVTTHGFTKFPSSRHFASYCGTAPFPHSSGSSVRGKTQVSHLANKKIKSLLDLCAKSAIVNNSEMKAYYHRRLAEGKGKMCTINIVRNKLLSRIFAVVKRGTPYVDIMAYSG